ncbi:tRNA-intron lyase [Candidatus Woesearchaeota archaeon]|nr:tRNA-intron lyase [Candidatus Woesearchaeota archaeon]
MAKAKRKAKKKAITKSIPKIKKGPDKEKIKAEFLLDKVLTENSNESQELYTQSRYGTPLESGRLQLSMVEGLYLIEKSKIEVYKTKTKKLKVEEYVRKARRQDKNFWTRYCVYKDIRNRGYIIKTALKFGADFRVYDRGVKPGEDHARWIIYPVSEDKSLTWYEFAAKNRVAHSTRKRVLIGVVDEENDVSYWEVRWMRP